MENLSNSSEPISAFKNGSFYRIFAPNGKFVPRLYAYSYIYKTYKVYHLSNNQISTYFFLVIL